MFKQIQTAFQRLQVPAVQGCLQQLERADGLRGFAFMAMEGSRCGDARFRPSLHFSASARVVPSVAMTKVSVYTLLNTLHIPFQCYSA